MKFIKLFESYESQRELQKLKVSILTRMGEKIFESLESDTDEIIDIPYVKFEDLYPDYFGVLKQFIIDFKDLQISVVNEEFFKIRKLPYHKALYLPSKSNSKRYILMCDDDGSIVNKINDAIKGDWGNSENNSSIKLRFAQIIDSKFNSSLLHELQHAYDDWRSKGKFHDVTPTNFYDKRKKSFELMNGLKDLKEEELDFVFSQSREYLNLPYEVDARFTEIIARTSFYHQDLEKSFEIGKDVLVMNPINTILIEFKHRIYFDRLNDIQKKRVLRKFGQFYEIEKAFVAKMNKEAKPYSDYENE